MARFALICLIAFAAVVLVSVNAEKAHKSTTEKPTDAAFEETWENLKKGIDDFIKNVKDNEVVQNVTQALQEFGEKVKEKGHEIVEKFKTKPEGAAGHA